MRSGTKPGHHAGQKAAGLGTALAHDARGAFSGVWGCFPGLHTGSGRGQGKTPVRSGTQPGHHTGQKAAGLGAALAHGARGGFLR